VIETGESEQKWGDKKDVLVSQETRAGQDHDCHDCKSRGQSKINRRLEANVHLGAQKGQEVVENIVVAVGSMEEVLKPPGIPVKIVEVVAVVLDV